MKLIILVILSSLNLLLWLFEFVHIDNIYFLLPLFSVIFSIILVLPKIKDKKIEIKLLHFVLFGIIYFNTPLYFLAFQNSQELTLILLDLGISERTFVKANILLGISLPLILVGYIFCYKTASKKKYKTNVLRLSPIISYPFYIVFIVFLIISLSITGLMIGSNFIGVSSYYYILLTRSIIILSSLIFFNEMIFNYGAKKIKYIDIYKRNTKTFSCIFLYIIYVLIGGDRGPALVMLLMLAFGYLLIHNMRLKFTTFFLVIGLLFIFNSLFIFIEVFRQTDIDVLSISSIEHSLDIYDDYEKKAGLTLQTTALAIDGIENGIYPHSYGLFFVQSLLKGIPFFGSFFLNNIFGEQFIDGSADLITIQKSGIGYASGLGTSYLADTYIEFGLIGIIILSFFYGVLLGKFDLICQNKSFKNYSHFLLICLFAGYSFYTGRGTLYVFLANFIHTWLWFLLFKYVFIFFGYKFNMKLNR
jgi:oligosaccharide repeat unit polymerase